MKPIRIFHHFSVFFIALCALILTEGASWVSEASADIGLVTGIRGQISYRGGDETDKIRDAAVFMKIRKDDQFQLPENTEIQIVYFANGRKETWKGPVSIKAGESESRVIGQTDSKQNATVTSLPSAVAQEVSRITAIVDPSKLHRTGSSQLRGNDMDDDESKDEKPLKNSQLGDGEKRIIEAAKKNYQLLLENTSPNDITAELYLFSVLADYDQFVDMKDLIRVMRRKQPDNQGISQMEEWMKAQLKL